MTDFPAPRPTPPRGYVAVIRTIDRFTEWSGYVFLIVLVPLIFANVFEVFARYVLRDPTVWALEVTTMSYAVPVGRPTTPSNTQHPNHATRKVTCSLYAAERSSRTVIALRPGQVPHRSAG